MKPVNALPVPHRRADMAAWRRKAAIRRAQAVPSARGPTIIRLWLPLTPLFALLAPLALLAAPLADLHPAGRRLKPIRAVWALGAVLFSLSGTAIAVDRRDVHIRIRIL